MILISKFCASLTDITFAHDRFRDLSSKNSAMLRTAVKVVPQCIRCGLVFNCRSMLWSRGRGSHVNLAVGIGTTTRLLIH